MNCDQLKKDFSMSCNEPTSCLHCGLDFKILLHEAPRSAPINNIRWVAKSDACALSWRGAPLRRPSMQGRTLYNVTMVDQNKRYCLRSIRHYSRGCGYRMLTALGKEVIEKFKELHPTFTQTWQSIRTKIINDRVNEL